MWINKFDKKCWNSFSNKQITNFLQELAKTAATIKLTTKTKQELTPIKTKSNTKSFVEISASTRE